MTPPYRLTLPADEAAPRRALEAAERFLAEHDVPARAAYVVQLALEEIVTNVLKYGVADGGRHAIELTFELAAGTIRLLIEDDGGAFDPVSAPAPDLEAPLEERPVGGLGLHLVRTLVDRWHYERVGGRNRLHLWIGVEEPAES